jgi:hypothetical protein
MSDIRDAMIDQQWAQNFAREWIEAWNSHDLERILSHYTEDFEMTSPLIIERMGEPGGVLMGKTAIRPYWGKGLSADPPLRFELLEVFTGVRSITIQYRSLGRRLAAEALEFNDNGKVTRAVAHYGPMGVDQPETN